MDGPKGTGLATEELQARESSHHGLTGHADDTESAGAALDELKRRRTFAALFAIAGFQLHELESGGFLVCRWNLSRHCATLADVETFGRQVGAIR